jgi:hypothetical protein
MRLCGRRRIGGWFPEGPELWLTVTAALFTSVVRDFHERRSGSGSGVDDGDGDGKAGVA